MATAADRKQQQKDLSAKGYSITYLKDWQPRVDMWWHRDWLNNEGEMAKPAGTKVPNQPGNPDTQMRLSSRGLLPWEPGEHCRCKGCRERFAPVEVVAESLIESLETPPPFKPTEVTEVVASVVAIETQPPPTSDEHTHVFRGKKKGAQCYTPGCSERRPKRL